MQSRSPDRTIRGEITVNASVDEVWDAWLTEQGVKSFLAPACSVDARVGGPCEIYFDLEAERGQLGSEGARILALEPKKMLSITWNAPPHLPEVRKQWTRVVVRLKETPRGETKVTLTHDGWGEGKEWDEAFAYFARAWVDVVLPRLKHRFSIGLVDWSTPPKSD